MFQKAACAAGRATKSLLRVPRWPRAWSDYHIRLWCQTPVIPNSRCRGSNACFLHSGSSFLRYSPFKVFVAARSSGFSPNAAVLDSCYTLTEGLLGQKSAFFCQKKPPTYITYMVYMLRKESKAPGNKNMLSEGFSMMAQLCLLFERHRW